MGLFDFAQAAGEKLDQIHGQAEANVADSLKAKIVASGISVIGLGVVFDDGHATVSGLVQTPADQQKIVLLVGNTQGVSKVTDQLTLPPPPASAPVGPPAPTFTLYTVQKGDTLSKIAQHTLGAGNRYPEIFEANRPMLKDPNHIFPGQVLRIPPKTNA